MSKDHNFLVVDSKDHILTVSCGKFCPIDYSTRLFSGTSCLNPMCI